jgi:WD40 repeat protein
MIRWPLYASVVIAILVPAAFVGAGAESLPPQITHVSVNSVAFSPDGRSVLSGGVRGDFTPKLWDVASGQLLRTFVGHYGGVISVAFSPDGASVVSASGDDTLRLWDTATGQPLKTLLKPIAGHTLGPANSVAFSPDGRTLMSAQDNLLRLWDVASGRLLKDIVDHDYVAESSSSSSVDVMSVAFSPDGRTVLSGSDDKMLRLWDVASSRLLMTFAGHQERVTSVAFSPDGRSVLSGSNDDTLKLWDVASGRLLSTFTPPGRSSVNSVAFSPDGASVVSAQDDTTVRLWDVATGRLVKTFTGLPVQVGADSVAFSPDGRTVVAGSGGSDYGRLMMWDVASGEVSSFPPVALFAAGAAPGVGHRREVKAAAFSPDGRTVLSAGADATLRLWDVASGRLMRAGPSAVNCIAFSPDGRTVLSGTSDGMLELWDATTGRQFKILTPSRDPGDHAPMNSVAFSPDGRTVLSAESNLLQLWDLASGELLRTIVDHELNGQVRLPYSAGVHIYVKSVTFSPDGQTVLSGSQDGMLRLWDVASSRLLKTLMGHSDGVMSVAFSPDGRSALSGSDDDTLKLWDVASGRLRRTFEGHQRGVESVAFSPDGRSLLSGSADDKLKLWDAASGRLLKTLTGHGDIVRSVAFSPDGRSVLSASDDRTLKLWDVASGEVLATFPPGTGDGLKAPPDATPLSAAVGAETEYYRAFYSTTLPDAVGFPRLRTKMLRLPANVGWEQVTAHYQAQLAGDWEAEPADRTPSGLGLRVRVWRQGDRHFAVGLVDETRQDARGPFHILLVMSQPGD